MRPSLAFLLGVGICGVPLLPLNSGRPAAVAAAPTTAPAAPPVRLADVRRNGMAGDLGVAMGTVVAIHGTVVDGHAFNFKDAAGRTYVDADTVDGRRLNPPVRVEVRPHPFAKSPFNPPAAGTAVDLIGYETGGYTGIVDGEGRYTTTYPSTGYGFRSYVVVLR